MFVRKLLNTDKPIYILNGLPYYYILYSYTHHGKKPIFKIDNIGFPNKNNTSYCVKLSDILL